MFYIPLVPRRPFMSSADNDLINAIRISTSDNHFYLILIF